MELNDSKELQKSKPDSKKAYGADEEQEDDADKDENDEMMNQSKKPNASYENFEYDSESYYDVADDNEQACDEFYDENESEDADDDAIDIEEEDSDEESGGASKRSSGNLPNDSGLSAINEKISLSKKSFTAAKWVGKKVIRAPAVRRHFVTNSFKRVNTITDWKVCIPLSYNFIFIYYYFCKDSARCDSHLFYDCSRNCTEPCYLNQPEALVNNFFFKFCS